MRLRFAGWAATLVLVAAVAVAASGAAAAPVGLSAATPILTATQPWEQHAVFEPTVIYDARRELYRMWYSGGWDSCALGYADSRDGVHWNKAPGPVLGDGVGGLRQACRNNVIEADGRFILYVADYEGRVRVATSTDGVSWDLQPEPALTQPGWGTGTGIANTFVWFDGSQWQMLYDVNMIDHWVEGHATGADPYHFHDDGLGPIGGLVGESNGSCWVVPDRGGWRIYYLATTGSALILPTDIYTAWSRDGREWGPSAMVVEHDPSVAWQVDQVADPSVANGLLFFDGVDNETAVAAIAAVPVAAP